MDESQTMQGVLNRGFQGHITYSFMLPEWAYGVEIRLVFDKREPLEAAESLQADCKKALARNKIDPKALPGPVLEQVCHMPKAEINFSVFRNEQCLGTAHRDAQLKEVCIFPDKASDGFVPGRIAGGVMRVVLHCFNIVNDGTRYSLTVKGVSRP